MRVLIIICVLSCSIIGRGQIERGSILLNQELAEVDSFALDGKINLAHLRNRIEFLTNRDILVYNEWPMPKRKKAFIRHVKHLSEQLEEQFTDDIPLVNETMEIFYELCLFRLSLIQKAEGDASPIPSFKEMLQMGKDSRRSKKVFQYRQESSKEEAINVQELKDDPVDSPFWHAIPQDFPPYKRFGQLAKLKKIKPRKNMYILFDELSYSGSAPKIRALDLDLDNEWSLKWGDEVHTDVVGSRIFAALGYDVDHPYFYGKEKLTLIFDGAASVHDHHQLKDSIQEVYDIDMAPFISSSGVINQKMIDKNEKLIPYLGKPYVRFLKCAIEARPDRVKRLGSFMPAHLGNEDRRELRGALLAHALIGNWDTRIENTLLTTVHNGNYNYRVSASFSDLGTSMGVRVNRLPPDFKVGLVNEFDWEVVTVKKGKLCLTNPINSILLPYEKASYFDLKWMAIKIGNLDETSLKKIVKKAGWPDPIETLYLHKLASRRASILKAFEIDDPHPIPFDKNLTIIENGVTVIKDGKLLVDYRRDENPESFIGKKGRERNYGN